MENNKLYSERNLSREFLFTFIQTEKQWRYATVPIIVWIYTHIFEYVPLLIHVFWHLWIKQNKNKQICNLCFFRSKYLNSYFALSFGNMWNVDFPTAIGPQFQTNRLYIRLTFATQMYLRWHLCTSVSTQLYHWLRQWRYWARHAGVEPNTAFETEVGQLKEKKLCNLIKGILPKCLWPRPARFRKGRKNKVKQGRIETKIGLDRNTKQGNHLCTIFLFVKLASVTPGSIIRGSSLLKKKNAMRLKLTLHKTVDTSDVPK